LRTILLFLVFLLPLPAVSAENRNVVDDMVNVERQRIWNRFASQVFDLHRAQLARYTVRIEKRFGEYGGESGKGYYFRETTYFDAGTGRILSRVRTDRHRTDELQIVDVYVYDVDGRLQRDYSFTFLPWGRAAPLQTLINLHDYPDGLHAYRQFDASGNTLYEYCDGTGSGRRVRIALPEEKIGEPGHDVDDYRHCFAGLPTIAGELLAPQ
jgi:hypothetical protein